MHRPACFGFVSLAADSPCHVCTVMGPCARQFGKRTGFDVLLWPRLLSEDVAKSLSSPTPAMMDPACVACLETHFKNFGMRYIKSKKEWKYRTFSVLKVLAANKKFVAIELIGVPVWRVNTLRKATQGYQLKNVYPKTKNPRLPRYPIGSRVVAANAELASDLVEDLMRQVYWQNED